MIELRGVGKPIYLDHEPCGYVYFIQMDRIGPIKIGYAKDVGKRLISLQTSNPYPLKLLGYYKADLEHEKDWHNAFDIIRLEGEWFLPHPRLLREIEENTRPEKPFSEKKYLMDHMESGNWFCPNCGEWIEGKQDHPCYKNLRSKFIYKDD